MLTVPPNREAPRRLVEAAQPGWVQADAPAHTSLLFPCCHSRCARRRPPVDTRPNVPSVSGAFGMGHSTIALARRGTCPASHRCCAEMGVGEYHALAYSRARGEVPIFLQVQSG